MKPDRLICLRLCALFCLAAAGPFASNLSAAQPAGNPPAAAAQPTEEEKAALKVLDRWFARLDALYPKIFDPTYQAIVKGNLEALKARGEELRKEFAQDRYEDLKFDIMIEHHRIAGWLAEPAVKPLAPAAGK